MVVCTIWVFFSISTTVNAINYVFCTTFHETINMRFYPLIWRQVPPATSYNINRKFIGTSNINWRSAKSAYWETVRNIETTSSVHCGQPKIKLGLVIESATYFPLTTYIYHLRYLQICLIFDDRDCRSVWCISTITRCLQIFSISVDHYCRSVWSVLTISRCL